MRHNAGRSTSDETGFVRCELQRLSSNDDSVKARVVSRHAMRTLAHATTKFDQTSLATSAPERQRVLVSYLE